VEGYIFDAGVFGVRQIGGRGIAPIGSNLPRHHTVVRLMAFKHRHEALTIGRIAGFDDRIEDESTASGDQVEFVTVLTSRRPLTMMSVCGSNKLTTFSSARTISRLNTRRSVCEIICKISVS